MTIDPFSITISVFALAISAITAWLTLFRSGELRMTHPTMIFFGPDGPTGPLKVCLRTLLYSTAKRAQIIESMHVKLRRGETVQAFNIWVYGEVGSLARGSGLRVSEDGVVCYHHFLLPKDGTTFDFLPGQYTVETYATLVNQSSPVLLSTIMLPPLSQEQSVAIVRKTGVFFDWGPDSRSCHAHVDFPIPSPATSNIIREPRPGVL